MPNYTVDGRKVTRVFSQPAVNQLVEEQVSYLPENFKEVHSYVPPGVRRLCQHNYSEDIHKGGLAGVLTKLISLLFPLHR